MSASASQRIIDLFDFLRATGSHLPVFNAECAQLILDGLELLQPDEENNAIACDQLISDFEVIVESIRFREENPS